MCPFTVTVEHVPDRELGPLLTRLAEAGFENPTINHVDLDGASVRPPPRWRRPAGPAGGLAARAGARGRVISVAERARSIQALPRVHRHDARRGAVQIGLARPCARKRGRDRKYVVAFLSAGSLSSRSSSSSQPTTTSRPTSWSQSSRQRRRTTHVWRR